MIKKISETIALDSTRISLPLWKVGVTVGVISAAVFFLANISNNVSSNTLDIERLDEKVESQVQIIQEISVTVARSDEKISTVIELLKKND